MNNMMVRDYLIRLAGANEGSNSVVGRFFECPYCRCRVKDRRDLETHECYEPVMQVREWMANNPSAVRIIKKQLGMTVKKEKSMANVQICERDGKVITAAVAGNVYYRPNPNSDGKDYTLCPDCSRELYEFLHPQNSHAPIMVAFDPSQMSEGIINPAETTRTAIVGHVEAEYSNTPRYDCSDCANGETHRHAS